MMLALILRGAELLKELDPQRAAQKKCLAEEVAVVKNLVTPKCVALVIGKDSKLRSNGGLILTDTQVLKY